VLILGERPLHAVLAEYQAHYNMARPHQGIAQHVPEGEHDSRRSAETRLAARRRRGDLAHRAPLLDHPPDVRPYPRRSWGPEDADTLVRGHPRWQQPWLPEEG